MFRSLVAVCLCTAVFAQDYSANGDAQLAALLEEALRNNPKIAAAQKRYEAARQRPAQASSLPDPMPAWRVPSRRCAMRSLPL